MTHIMVPDGVLPWWLSTGGWLAAAALIAVALRRLRGASATRMVPLVAVMTALMVVVMSLELVPIGYEIHLTVLTGMIVGPWYGVIAAFLFNILRALVGDGAITNIGLNTCLTWLEIALGAALWSALRPLAAGRSPALAAGIATFAGLLLATVAFVGVVALSTVDPVRVAETGAYDVRAGGFKGSPLAGGLFGVHFLGGESAPGAGDPRDTSSASAGLAAFAGVFFVLAAIGALIEAAITGAVVAFIAKVRPHLLGLRPTAHPPGTITTPTPAPAA